MALPVPSFAALTAGNQPLSLFDQQFTALANGMTISCTGAGTNTIALTPNPNNFVPTTYTNGAPRFVWVQQATTTTGPITVNVAGLGPVTAYKQNGAVALGGVAGELVAGGVYTATYSSALTAGAGGFSIDLNAQGPTGPTGPQGPQGNPGAPGPTAGLPAGGAINQVLAKNSAADYDTSWQTIAGGGVSSWNTRIGAVTMTLADVTSVGGAPLASPTFTGTPAAPTATAGTNSTQVATTAFVASAVSTGTVLRSYLAGLGLSTVGAAITFSVATGVAADSTASRMMALTSALTKSTAAWAVGNNNGALDTGTIANSTWYHVHLIMRTDTNVVDVLISLSATAPTLPTNYTLFRRIGAMYSNVSSQWTLFHQLGDEFLLDVPNLQLNNANSIQTTPVLVSILAPTGVQVNALMRGFISSSAANTFILFTSPDEASQSANTPAGNVTADVPLTGTPAGAIFSLNLRTNTSAQVRAVANTTTANTTLSSYGWIDRRGRDA